MTTQVVYDYVIAGGGSAGCTLAARLAEDPDVTVLLVEAGGNGRHLFARMPAGNGFLFGNPKFDWCCESVPQPGLNGRKIYYPRGKGLGGSSLLNGMIYIRGHPADYDRWRQKGLPGWSYGDVLPYFKRSGRAAHRAGDPYHGVDGPLRLTPAGNYDRVNEIFVEACRQAGADWNDDPNGVRQTGVSRIDTKVHAGQRQATGRAYLATHPKNLTVVTKTRVLGVAMEGARAAGLRLSSGTVRAAREVILCLGAFGSPHCLMLSGIGPADHLREHGISVHADLPGVGATLYDHPVMSMQYGLLDDRLSMSRFQRLDRAALLGLRYLLTGTGPGAAPFWSTQLFHALRDPEMPELQVFFTPMLVKEEAGGSGWTIQNLLSPGRAVIARGKMAASGAQFDVNLLRPRSSGHLQLASTNPDDMPVIDPGYFRDPADIDDLVAGVRHMREVVSRPAFDGVIGAESAPGVDALSDADLAEGVRNFTTTGHHPVSTCRMGADSDPGAVLDAELRVRGTEGLRVADASSFPDLTNGNTNAPVIMLAEKAADMILGRPPLPPEDPRMMNEIERTAQ
ncbi:MAG: GMC family oxidoreductase [Hyphomicrobiaceae bacterium]